MRRLSQAETHPLMQVTHFLNAPASGPRVVAVDRGDGADRMRREVLAGLSDPAQPWVPPTYFYDRRGSELYEAITALEEYYPTRTEAALLSAIADELGALVAPTEVVELGSGSSSKTHVILDALGAHRRDLTYMPLDVSPTMLDMGAEQLVARYSRLRVLGLAGQYEDGFRALPPATNRLFVFLGGTIGNFKPEFQEAFFAQLAAVMRPGNRLLLGFDRRAHDGKPAEVIEAAYNDALGITAEFNLNMLAHLNAALGGDFELGHWSHEAHYDRESHRIEMHLRSLEDQEVTLSALGRSFAFRRGQRILTELSRKFDPQELAQWFESRGFRCERRWTDEQGYVGLMLLERQAIR
jgi:dimethylhistidine N-methyltransferase